MMRIKLFSILIAATVLSSCATNKAQQWLKQQESAKTLKPVVFKDVNLTVFKEQYSKNKATWDKAFAFMQTQDLENLAVGKYPIDGDQVFASVTEIFDKPFADTKWESHKNYIDLQYVIRGKEKIGMANSEGAKVVSPYNPAKDVANYEIDNAKFYEANSSTFYLFFPSDAHRPNTKVNEEKVKKLVIKIRVAE